MTLNDLANKINATATKSGFWEKERNFGEMIALAHSELSEALEEYRDGKPEVYFKHAESCSLDETISLAAHTCNCTPKPEGAVVELADCIIRCLDTAHSRMPEGWTMDEVVKVKMAYNAQRPYKHGKAF